MTRYKLAQRQAVHLVVKGRTLCGLPIWPDDKRTKQRVSCKSCARSYTASNPAKERS